MSIPVWRKKWEIAKGKESTHWKVSEQFFLFWYLLFIQVWLGTFQNHWYILISSRGGGAEAVAFFFVLSGFIEALHQRNEVPDIKNITRLCIAKVKKFYGLHVFFLLAVTPTVIVSVVKAPLQAGGRMIINLLLLQSWFPDEQIWLSYNSVTWFISTLAFLFLFIIPMHWISNHLEQKWPTGRFYCGLLVIIWLLDFILAILLLKKNVSNIKYYLYAFPPSRLFDYASGFILGRFFICHKNMRLVKKRQHFWKSSL